MPKFAANLSMLFTELPFMERFAAARAAGFDAVEYLFPYAYPKQALAAALKAHGLTCSEVHLRILGTALHTSLAKSACENRADLLVIGGFGHSRVQETLFGGVTNTFLRDPPLPVLLTH